MSGWQPGNRVKPTSRIFRGLNKAAGTASRLLDDVASARHERE